MNKTCPKCESKRTTKAGGFFFAMFAMFFLLGFIFLRFIPLATVFFTLSFLMFIAIFANIFLKKKLYYCRDCQWIRQNK